MLYLNLEGSSAILALNNTCSGQYSPNTHAGILDSQKLKSWRRPQEVTQSLLLPSHQTCLFGLIQRQISCVGALPLPQQSITPDNVFLKLNHSSSLIKIKSIAFYSLCFSQSKQIITLICLFFGLKKEKSQFFHFPHLSSHCFCWLPPDLLQLYISTRVVLQCLPIAELRGGPLCVQEATLLSVLAGRRFPFHNTMALLTHA